MPSHDAARALLAQRTAWQLLDATTDDDRAAVYFVRTTDGAPIARWKGTDRGGFIYIGMAGLGSTGMSRRSEELATGVHQVVQRLEILGRVCPAMKTQTPKCQYAFIPLAGPAEASFWESYFLFSYHRYFADRPPLNRRLEQDIIAHCGWGASDETLAWPEVSDLLLK